MTKHASLPPSLGALLESSPVRTLHEVCGGEACLVGGVLRDALLGRDAADIDVVVSGGGREIAERLATALEARLVHLGGERFASYRLVAKKRVIDLWDRGEQSLEEDLRRRDFTVNSIALELGSERLVDPFGGRRDLEARRLRATSSRSFKEDPLRILRLVRFAVSLEFDIGPETLELARASVPQVGSVAIERVRGEVELLIRHSQRVEAVRLLSLLDLFASLWDSASLPVAQGDAARQLTRLEEWSAEIRRSTSDLEQGVDSFLTSMALLYVSAAKERSDDSSWPQLAATLVRESRLLTGKQRSIVARLTDLRTVPDSTPEARWFLHHWGDRWLDAVAVWGVVRGTVLGPQKRLQRVESLAALAREHGRELFSPPRLLNGDEVGRHLGIGPGPEVGRCLDALRRLQIEGSIATRSEALAFVANWKVGEGN